MTLYEVIWLYSFEKEKSLIDVEAVGVWLESKPVTMGQDVWAADVLFDPVCSFTMWSIYKTAQPLACSPHPSNTPGSPQAAWQGEHFVCPHTPPLTTHTHYIFSDFSLCDLYFLVLTHAPVLAS